MSEATERATVGLARVLQVTAESVTYYHRKAGTSETVSLAFVEQGQGDETGAAGVVLETSDLSTVALEGDEIERASGEIWFVQAVRPVIGTVQQLDVLIHQP